MRRRDKLFRFKFNLWRSHVPVLIDLGPFIKRPLGPQCP